jgi:hypothetical protein
MRVISNAGLFGPNIFLSMTTANAVNYVVPAAFAGDDSITFLRRAFLSAAVAHARLTCLDTTSSSSARPPAGSRC